MEGLENLKSIIQHPLQFQATQQQQAKVHNPTVSDIEVLWNALKVALYIISIVLSIFPVLVDAAAFPVVSTTVDHLDHLDHLDHNEQNGGDQPAAKSSSTKSRISDSNIKTTTSKEKVKGATSATRSSRWASLKATISDKVHAITATTVHTLRFGLVLCFISVAAYVTMSFSVSFLVADSQRYLTVRQWLARGSWVVAAYEHVSASPAQWFFSSQALFFVSPMALYLVLESARCPPQQRFRPLASLLVSSCVALSVGFPLAVLAMLASWQSVPRRASRHCVPLRWAAVVAPLVVAFFCVVLVPVVVDRAALGLVVGTLHLSLLVPAAIAQFAPHLVRLPIHKGLLLLAASSTSSSQHQKEDEKEEIIVTTSLASESREWLRRSAAHMWVPVSFVGFSVACLLMQIMNLLHISGSVKGDVLFATLARGFCSNSCQCALSVDVVMCSVSVVAWIWLLPSLTYKEMVVLSVLTPMLSMGCTFSAAVAIHEMRILGARLTTPFEEVLFGVGAVSASRTAKSVVAHKTGELDVSPLDSGLLQVSPPSSPLFSLDETFRPAPSAAVAARVENRNSSFQLAPNTAGVAAAKRKTTASSAATKSRPQLQQQKQQNSKRLAVSSSSSSSSSNNSEEASIDCGSSASTGRRCSSSDNTTTSSDDNDETMGKSSFSDVIR